MPPVAIPARSDVFDTTKLWPMACAGSLPACLSVTSTSVQSAAIAIFFLSNCIASLPVMSTLQVLGAANAPAEASSREANARVRMVFMMSPGTLVRDAEPLLHHRAGSGVLQELLLGGKEMVLDGERCKRRLVE